MALFRLSAFADEADSSLAIQIEALKKNGIGQIEIRGVNGKSVADLSDGEAREARGALDEGGISVSSMGSPFGKYKITDPIDDHIEKFKRGLEIAGILGAKKMRMFSFFMPEGEDPANYRSKVFGALGRMLDLAQAAGVKLCHENEKDIYGDTDARCLDLMREFGDRMGFIFDPANFIQCGVVPRPAFPALAEYIDYMHIKDAALSDGSVVPSGKGDGDIPWIIDRLDSLREGEVVLSIEPHLAVFEGLGDLQGEELKHRYSYPDKLTAFAAASDALKEVLSGLGFKEGGAIWSR